MKRTIACLATCLAATSVSQAQQPSEPCVPAKWGPNDQIGNMNHVTPEKTLSAVRLITKGKAYRLAIETNKNTPAYPPRTFAVTIVQLNAGGSPSGRTKSTFNDDVVNGWVGVGSQLDGFGHAGIDHVYYNCNKAADFIRPDGLRKLGTENVPAVATRGILLDMAGLLGTDVVKEGTAFNKAEIEAALKRQNLKPIEPGDVVLFHTGWLSLIGKDDKRFGAGEPGLSVDGARYLAERGVAMVGADTWGVEVVPFEKNTGIFHVHQILLAMNGIHLLEFMNTQELAKDQAWEFLFTLGTPRITGAVQAIINPIVIR
jgi:kynurenine formamidase